MKIKVMRSILIDGKHVEQGSTCEVTDDVGAYLCAARDAVPAQSHNKAETAMAAPHAEHATQPKPESK